MSANKVKTRFSIETKYQVIKLIDKNKSFNEIADQFCEQGVKVKNIYQFKKSREKIINDFESSRSSNRRSTKGSQCRQIDDELLEFVSRAPTDGLPINSIVLKEKAIEIAKKLGNNEFVGSNGFIDRFKKRHGIKFTTFHGEANSVPESVCSDWLEIKLPEIIEGYEDKDIFNGDEFGLFWRLLPNKSYVVKDKALRNAKPSKERISVFIAANCLGEKLKPIVIGKSKTPRCFRNKNQLPVIYRYNQNAWMTSEIWTNYVKQLNKTMTIENRRIILFVDNCPAHSFIELSNIKLVFLPPNTTSRLQPMDAGVIHSLKASYRKRLVKRFLAIYEEKKCFDLKDIDLYDAIILLNNIWQDMDPTIIKNCFHQSGFLSHDNDDDISQVVTEDSNESIPVDMNDWNQLKEALDSNELEFNEFIRFDDNVVCAEEQTNPLIEKKYRIC